MAESINLHKSKEITAAGKLIADLSCPLYMPIDERGGKGIVMKGDIIHYGIPATIEVVDYVLDLHRQMLGIGHRFMKFLADHPDANGLVPQNFVTDSLEHQVLKYVQAMIAGDDFTETDYDPLFSAVTDALGLDDGPLEGEQHNPHMSRADVWTLLAKAESDVRILSKIKSLLTPLMEGTPPLATTAPAIPTTHKFKVRLGCWPPDEIIVRDRLRKGIKEDVVRGLMDAIQKIGLPSPPTVRLEKDKYCVDTPILVAGLHRLEACKRLGLETITCWEFHGTETEAELWEIAENVQRAELTVQERADQIARWIELVELQSGQVVHNESKRADGRGHRHEGGIAKAARELTIAGPTENAKRKTVERAIQIASIAPAAKEAAAAAGLSNNQKALLTVATAEPDRQVQAVAEIVQRKTRPVDTVDREVERLMTAWNAAGDEARRVFLERVG